MSAQPDPIGSLWYRATPRGPRPGKTSPKIVEYRQPRWAFTPTTMTVHSDKNMIAGNSYDTPVAVEEPEQSETVNAITSNLATEPLFAILSSLNELMKTSDDESDVVATEYAYREARAVIETALGRLLDQKKPVISNALMPAVMTDDRGGVRLAWRNGDKHVRVNFGAFPEARSYLYFESLAEHNVDELQPTNLFKRLEWLLTP